MVSDFYNMNIIHIQKFNTEIILKEKHVLWEKMVSSETLQSFFDIPLPSVMQELP